MSRGPYDDVAEVPPVLDAPDAPDALGAEELVVDEVAPADELGATAAVVEESEVSGAKDPGAVAALEVAAAELPAVEVLAVEVLAVEAGAVEADGADGVPSSSPLARAWWPRPDRLAWRNALERSCRNARKSRARLSLEAPAVADELEAVPALAPAEVVAEALDAGAEESGAVPAEVEPAEVVPAEEEPDWPATA